MLKIDMGTGEYTKDASVSVQVEAGGWKAGANLEHCEHHGLDDEIRTGSHPHGKSPANAFSQPHSSRPTV